MTTMREMAERVLFSTTLDEKLRPGPTLVSDETPGPAITLPHSPGRPQELRIRSNGVRVDFPGTHHLDDDRERGILLHFLANHELLAAELMALVLLRFPDAPPEYRAGVYEAMREEQAHALMYVRRMRECGINFGDLPVNDHFWRIIAPMETPLDFVTRLNLTFEQANLDFSKHYATLFRQVGDTATAAVLEKIHLDEIGHVGHGLKWFRRWKNPQQSDWNAFKHSLAFPLTPARAKGLAPFNTESRRLAGLDDDFIRQLEVSGHSRGRTPIVHWFNPNAESHARSHHTGKIYQPDKTALALELDLEALILGCCRRDDAALLRRPPSVDHLASLKAAGFEIPEILTESHTPGRKLGGLRPWAWSPDASSRLKPFAADIAPNQPNPWRSPIPNKWLSKEIGLQLEQHLGPTAETGILCTDVSTALHTLSNLLKSGQALLKAAFSCAGNGHLRVNHQSDPTKTLAWIRNTLASHHALVVEPWLDRCLDFSALYESTPHGPPRLLGMTHLENDPAGRFLGIRVGAKWGSLLPPEIATFLFREANVMNWYEEKIPAALTQLLHGYTGPLCVDAMVHRTSSGQLALKPVVELNVRTTMGRLAWEWMNRLPSSQSGRLRILKRANLTPESTPSLTTNGGLFLTDPAHAEKFVAHWQPQ